MTEAPGTCCVERAACQLLVTLTHVLVAVSMSALLEFAEKAVTAEGQTPLTCIFSG
jgi:hypothetical protein